MEIVVDGAVVTAVTVVLAFIVNQALAWLGVEVSELAKKAIVYVVAVGITGYYGYQQGFPLPDVAADPIGFSVALLGYGTLVFKSAQAVYDKLWTGLLKA